MLKSKVRQWQHYGRQYKLSLPHHNLQKPVHFPPLSSPHRHWLLNLLQRIIKFFTYHHTP